MYIYTRIYSYKIERCISFWYHIFFFCVDIITIASTDRLFRFSFDWFLLIFLLLLLLLLFFKFLFSFISCAFVVEEKEGQTTCHALTLWVCAIINHELEYSHYPCACIQFNPFCVQLTQCQDIMIYYEFGFFHKENIAYYNAPLIWKKW